MTSNWQNTFKLHGLYNQHSKVQPPEDWCRISCYFFDSIDTSVTRVWKWKTSGISAADIKYDTLLQALTTPNTSTYLPPPPPLCDTPRWSLTIPLSKTDVMLTSCVSSYAPLFCPDLPTYSYAHSQKRHKSFSPPVSVRKSHNTVYLISNMKKTVNIMCAC